MKEVSNGKKQIDEQKVEKVEKIKNEKVEKKNISKEEKKEKIKKFIEKGKKEKKVKYKDIVKFVDEAEITPEEMAKIYDTLAELNLNIIMDDAKETSKEAKYRFTFWKR